MCMFAQAQITKMQWGIEDMTLSSADDFVSQLRYSSCFRWAAQSVLQAFSWWHTSRNML